MPKLVSVDYTVINPWKDHDPGGTGWFDLYTIPADEFWEVFEIYGVRTGGATITLGNIAYKDQQTGLYHTVSLTTAGSEIIHKWNPPRPLPSGTILRISIGAYNAGDTVIVTIGYRRTKWTGN